MQSTQRIVAETLWNELSRGIRTESLSENFPEKSFNIQIFYYGF